MRRKKKRVMRPEVTSESKGKRKDKKKLKETGLKDTPCLLFLKDEKMRNETSR